MSTEQKSGIQPEQMPSLQPEETMFEPPTMVDPSLNEVPEGFTLVSRKSRKNPYTRTLKNISSMIHWYNNQHKPHDEKFNECEFKKFVMKLTPRDIIKINQLMNFIKEDPYYDTIEKITSFNQQEYLQRKNIKPDDEK